MRTRRICINFVLVYATVIRAIVCSYVDVLYYVQHVYDCSLCATYNLLPVLTYMFSCLIYPFDVNAIYF